MIRNERSAINGILDYPFKEHKIMESIFLRHFLFFSVPMFVPAYEAKEHKS